MPFNRQVKLLLLLCREKINKKARKKTFGFDKMFYICTTFANKQNRS